METQDWDQHIIENSDRFQLLRIQTHQEHPYSIFPIFSRKWIDILGHASRHQMIDAEMSQIAYLLDIMRNVDIHATHDRYDLTGNNLDATQQQKQVFEGDPSNARDFHHPDRIQERYHDCQILASYLESHGHDMAFWKAILTGKQDPWEKLKANDVNRLTTQFDLNLHQKDHYIYHRDLDQQLLCTTKSKLPNDLLCCLPKTIQDPIRIGCNSDGGYVVPRDLLHYCDDLLSGGLGENWSFDRHWKQIKPQSKIHVYDGTVSLNNLKDYLRLPYQEFFGQSAVHFQENLGPNHTDLNTAIKRLDSRRILLKMDIEGGEFALLDQILENRALFPGIVIEIHFANYLRSQFVQAVMTLRQHYELVHLHGNNHTPLGAEGSCDCYEFTFIRSDLINDNTNDRHEFYLPGIDFSNVPGLKDWQFYFEKN
jgi:hypothetical protein